MRSAAPPRVVVSGAGGLIGAALVPALAAAGHAVVRLVRRPPRVPDEILWDPGRGSLDPRALEGCDAVVHLAGAPLAARWTAARRRAVRESRVAGTRLLAQRLAALERPPRVLLSASAMGIYGDRGDAVLTEESAPGSGFLPDLCRAWEEAAAPAVARGIRVVHPRTALVLAPRGGALARLLPAFRLGLGGPVGRPGAWWSWIALDDLVAALRFALAAESLSGPFNAASPQPVRSAEFARTLARVLRRPALLPVPAAVLRLAFGAMAEETLLASVRLAPARLAAAGFAFRFPALEDALRHVLRASRG
ncbi:MAG: TIGR01777 family protein [Candidatus Eisenbacteria bacterium]|nr:TIGR01777 family protein [Candidatus Eisenbacteria bacterium]